MLSKESWLEEINDRKMGRYEEETPSKYFITQATSSQPSKKMKKQKTISALAIDSTTSDMLVEIVEPQKEGIFHDLSKDYFQIKMVNLGIRVHNSMVNMWKSINVKIKDKMEELRAEKEILNASNKELVEYIRFALGSTSWS